MTVTTARKRNNPLAGVRANPDRSTVSSVVVPTPQVGTPSSSGMPTDPPASSASSGPCCARPQPRHTTQTPASPPASAPAQSSPLVTAPVLTADPSQTTDSLVDDNDSPTQRDSQTALTDTQTPGDIPPATPATLTNAAAPGTCNDNGDEDDNSTADPVLTSNSNNTGHVSSNSSTSGTSDTPQGSAPTHSSSRDTRSKQPRKVTG
ncbi:hypothetical protein BDM02DRAFT_3273606, partial [Thelephora ganbajun]